MEKEMQSSSPECNSAASGIDFLSLSSFFKSL